MTNCAFEGCTNEKRTRGYCGGHYSQFRQGKTLKPLRTSYRAPVEPRICERPECTRVVSSLNLCNAHYEQQRAGKPFSSIKVQKSGKAPYEKCVALGCERFNHARGLCERHYTATKTYGISIERYTEMFRNGCQICGVTEGRLHIDHDHSCCTKGSCGKCVRGVLCHKCNTALGLLGDDVTRMSKAIGYLERSSRVR